MSPAPEPDDLNLGVRDVIDQAVHRAKKAAHVENVWSSGGEMWFVEMTPTVDGAAPMSVGSSAAADELNVTVGQTWFEIFSVRNTEWALAYLADIVEAVLNGDVEESGRVDGRYARIQTRRGVINVGAAHLPFPWRFRRFKRRYEPYADR